MKILYYAFFCILLFLFSCKSSKDISSKVLTSHLNGNVDSVVISDYSNWNYNKQEGIDLLETVKYVYNKKGYITKVEEMHRGIADTMVAVKTINYKYDSKQHLIEKEVVNFDSIGKVKNAYKELLINSVKNVKTWKVKDDTEIRTFENDTETITLLTDSGTVEGGLTYYMQYTPDGQLLKQRLSTNHIAVINTYKYHPTSRFLLKQTVDSSFSFSEQSVIDSYMYAYIDIDKLGNWMLRTRFSNDEGNPKMIYQTQKIYYRK